MQKNLDMLNQASENMRIAEKRLKAKPNLIPLRPFDKKLS